MSAVFLVFLVAGLALSGPVHSAEFVPGLPVFSADGSTDTSKTIPGFRAKVWQIPQPDTLVGSYSDIKVDRPEVMVDGRGRVWMAWSLGTVCNGEPCSGAYLAELDQEGPAGTLVPVFPFDTYYWWRYGIAMGPDGPWCASWMIPWEERRNEDYSSPVRVHPCEELSSVWSPEEFGGWFEFLGEEPVMITPTGDGLSIQWIAQSGRTERILPSGIDEYWFGGSTTDIARAGGSFVALWRSYFRFPVSGVGRTDYNFIAIIHESTEDMVIVPLSTQDYDEKVEADVPRNLSLALGLGSDGPSRLFVSFLVDDNPKSESVETEPKVRAYEAASLDSVAEWTLGYGKIKSPFPYRPRDLPAHVTVTSNHEKVGFAVSRAGSLDLWVLIDQSWYGPYPISSNISGSADIAVDAEGRYWLVWDDDADVYAAVVTPVELGLDGASTGVAEPLSRDPSAPVLRQNSPNPFNARTAIEVRIPLTT